MEKHPLVRTIYLYLFTIVGLSLLVAGAVRFIDMGLKTFVFVKADEAQRIQQKYYGGLSSPVLPFAAEKMQVAENDGKLTDEERATIKKWAADYKAQQEEFAKIDYVASDRQREASGNLAMILVGLPLYLYHWTLIKREVKKSAENKDNS
jgi:hypothetical protein